MSTEENYTHIADLTKKLITPGLATPGLITEGQGNSDTPPEFTGHWITMACDYYYDPSYGTQKVPIDNGADYENSAFSGFIANDPNLFCRENLLEKDVTYTNDD